VVWIVAKAIRIWLLAHILAAALTTFLI
jgi:hypothetical protein